MSLLLPPNFLPPRFGAAPADFIPWQDPNTLFYWDPDDAAAATLSVITDKTGNHSLNQPTGSKQATNTAAQFGTHRGLVMAPASSHKGYLFDTPWSQSHKNTIYSVVKYVATGATGQVLWQRSLSGTVGPAVCMCSISPGFSDKAQTYAGGTDRSAYSASALVNGTTYLVKFGWDLTATNRAYVAVNGGAAQSAVANVTGPGTFTELGLSSLSVVDLVSTLGVQAIATGWHDGDAYDLNMTAYFKAWAGIV